MTGRHKMLEWSRRVSVMSYDTTWTIFPSSCKSVRLCSEAHSSPCRESWLMNSDLYEGNNGLSHHIFINSIFTLDPKVVPMCRIPKRVIFFRFLVEYPALWRGCEQPSPAQIASSVLQQPQQALKVLVVTQRVQQVRPGAHPVIDGIRQHGKQEVNSARAVPTPFPSGMPWSFPKVENAFPKTRVGTALSEDLKASKNVPGKL